MFIYIYIHICIYIHTYTQTYLYIFYLLCYYSSLFFLSFSPLCLAPHLPPAFPPQLSSCQWVIHTSSLASPFPMLFLTFPSILFPPIMLLNLCTIFPFSSYPLSADNPPNENLHIYDSVPVLIVCLGVFLVCFFRFSC